MDRWPLVSIIISSYNYGRFLPQAIGSAINQTYPRVETIVVDDGSTDGSVAAIASFGDRIISHSKATGGQASSFNAGIGRSRGDIVLFLDSDDLLLPSAAGRIVEAWKPGGAKAHFRLGLCNAAGVPLGRTFPPRRIPLPFGEIQSQLLATGAYASPTGSGNAYARDALNRILPIPETEWRTGADLYLLTLAPFHGPVIAIDEVLGYYRLHGDNASIAPGPAQALRQSLRLERQRQELLRNEANRLGLPDPHFPESMLWVAAMQVLERRFHGSQHGVVGGNSRQLAATALRELWSAPHVPLRKRALSTATLVSAAFLPAPLLAKFVPWLVWPQSQPEFVERLL